VAQPSDLVRAGQVLTLRFLRRLLEVRLLELPQKPVSKKAAREMFEVLRDERVEGA
jgi:ribosomal 50S subunit-recycling heat shock protein